jgi:hypothetical protein
MSNYHKNKNKKIHRRYNYQKNYSSCKEKMTQSEPTIQIFASLSLSLSLSPAKSNQHLQRESSRNNGLTKFSQYLRDMGQRLNFGMIYGMMIC